VPVDCDQWMRDEAFTFPSRKKSTPCKEHERYIYESGRNVTQNILSYLSQKFGRAYVRSSQMTFSGSNAVTNCCRPTHSPAECGYTIASITTQNVVPSGER
jgi:hypothetical protein